MRILHECLRRMSFSAILCDRYFSDLPEIARIPKVSAKTCVARSGTGFAHVAVELVGRGPTMASSAPAGLKLAEATTRSHTSELRRLSTFLEISQTLASASNQKTALHQVLGILERHHNVIRSTVALLNANDEIEVVASEGPARWKGRREISPGRRHHRSRRSERQADRGAARLARADVSAADVGSTGAGARGNQLRLVPILLNRKAVGALGADFRFKADRDFDRTVKFLGVVASLMAQAIRIQRVIDAERDRLREENTHLKLELRERYDFSNILGTSGPMRLVYEQVAQVARTDTTVLVRGESGTGKELIAQAIHYNSLRAKRPFIKVSCAALPESLIESELFGYEKGAFTGAHAREKGTFRAGGGGHAVSRRNRRAQPLDADQAAARAAGARIRAARAARRRFARTCG